jgi:NAD-reducing hydrogenase large subunit
MTKNIEIDPITRIEGHAKVTLRVGDDGVVDDARLHVTQFRGFEKFVEGRPFQEMPSLMARICGICPVSHLIASAKACDALMAVEIPPTAVMLRKVMNLAQIIQSHALSFFHLSSPDLLLGMDSDPEQRNIFGLAAAKPQLARDGIALRRFGQSVIELLGGKRIHPAWIVPGGVSEPLSEEKRDALRAMMPEAHAIAEGTLAWFVPLLPRFVEEIERLGKFPSHYVALLDKHGRWEHYDGNLVVVNPEGKIVREVQPSRYAEIIGEAVEDWTYLKFPYYKHLGYPQGLYRVGPLARLNAAKGFGTPKADHAFAEYRKLEIGPISSSFHQHYARLVEIVGALEELDALLADPRLLGTHARATAGANAREGVGVSEAPRGTLIHHYKIDDNGLMVWANLIIATSHNNLAMNKGILQAAKHFVKADKLQEGMLNRVEAVIRSFDPCLSCSTHAVGRMPLEITLVGPDGAVLDEARR